MHKYEVKTMEFYVDKVLYTARPEEKRTPNEEVVYDALEKLGISFHRADHDAADTIADCLLVEEVLDGKICKNLFLCNRQKTNFYLLLMPGDKPFKTKDITQQIQSARLSFASGEDMERMLGCTPGSASVLGLLFDKEHQVNLLIDEELLRDETMCCHPCKNTSTLKLAMEDVLNILLPHTGHAPRMVDLPRYDEQ